MKRLIIGLVAVFVVSIADQATAAAVGAPQLPLTFEANAGQTDRDVKFLARTAAYGAFLTPTGVVLAVRGGNSGTPVRVEFAGARREAELTGLDALPGKANYFTGKDPARWRRDIPTFARVRAERVYEGVDVIYYASGSRLEFDFIVAPGADPGVIALDVTGADGVEIAPEGDLAIRVSGGSVRLHKPAAYQEVAGARHEIAGRYRLDGERRVRFEVAAYDAARPLVIDPVLSYSSYHGGSQPDGGYGVAVGSGGSVYLTGGTYSADFPVHNAVQQGMRGYSDAFVTKLRPDGSIEYSTFLGGGDMDFGFGIAVDGQGNAYVTGMTYSPDFPRLNAFQPNSRGSEEAFVSKLDGAGALVYSTYLGGRGIDTAKAIAVDSSGSAFVTGLTSSDDFPVNAAFQPTFGTGYYKAFVTRLHPTGASLVYSTYLGGSVADGSSGIAIDASGNAYVTGTTESPDFPVQPQSVSTWSGGADAFVAKLNPTGSALIYSRFVGGSGHDWGAGIAVDPNARAYVVGRTASSDFYTTWNVPQRTLNGGEDAFIVKLEASGDVLYSTYLGGNGWDGALAVAVNARGQAYVTGGTTSTNFPTVNAPLPMYGGHDDAFVVKVHTSGDALLYSTYLGGSGSDEATGIALDLEGHAWVTGMTGSANFPIENATQNTNGGSGDAFVARITEDAFVYVTALGQSAGSLSIVDAQTNTAAPPSPLGVMPYGVALTPDGGRAFVADLQQYAVLVVDTSTAALLQSIPTGAFPAGIAMSPDGRRALVTNYGSHSVTVIDVPARAAIQTIPVGQSPWGVAFSPDTLSAYVANFADHTVSLFWVWPQFSWYIAEIQRVAVGQYPVAVAVSPDSRFVYVTHLYSDSVSVLDSFLSAIASIPVGSQPRGVVVSPTGTRAYVANYGSNTVSVIDTLTRQVVTTIPVGDAPASIAINPTGTRVYVANSSGNTVSVIDTATNTVVATPAVGAGPHGIAVTP